jgi:prevent-host-death family protein
MKTVSIQQTRNNLAQIIDKAALAGESFLVTKYNKPKAKIVPYAADDQNIDQNQKWESVHGLWQGRTDIESGVKYEDKLRK